MFVLLKVQSLQLSFRPAGVSLGGGGAKAPFGPPGYAPAPPPWTLSAVTSSALRIIEKHPHSWTFTSTRLGHCPCDVIHIPRGGGDRSRSRTLCIGFQYRGSSRGGGDHPCHPPPPPLDPPLLSETKKLGEAKAERTTYHHNALLMSKSYYIYICVIMFL